MPKSYSKYKPRIAVILGWNLGKISFLKKSALKKINTPYGRVSYYHLNNCFLIARHGIKENLPPHKINHKANISAIKKLAVEYIFSFNSVGSLKRKYAPGTILIPADYIDLDPPTFFDKKAKFTVPELSFEVRKILYKILKKLNIRFKNGGIYFNTKGPRLETRAEINLIKNYADVVGMTMAKEATLAKEMGIKYASLCSIDNYAHGLVKKPFTLEKISENQDKAALKIEKIIKEI